MGNKDKFSAIHLPLGKLKLPPAGQVQLWFLDLRNLGSPLIASNTTDKEQVLSPRHERTIRRFYLRLLLGAYLGVSGKDVKISRMVKGKPVLDPKVHQHQLDFSSAGSNGCCLIGISTAGQIGVDLEMSGRQAKNPASLVKRYFSVEEQERFAALEKDLFNDAFLHTWTCKEAVVKAAGHGIANQLCRFTVCIDPSREAQMLEMDGDEASEWKLSMVSPAQGFVSCIALRHKSLQFEGFNLHPQNSG
ncbi:MAG: 4'-phosphopantetheinyl transferase [Lysobacterales bacterium]|jgi:4'-phosphopantetheinyl transferase